jgi:6-phosphogluconate dehydrogenase
MNKKIGFIGLGKMGYRMAENLLEHDYDVIAYDINTKQVESISEKGAQGAQSLEEMFEYLVPSRTIVLSVPAGESTDKLISDLRRILSSGDVVVDSGNSFFEDSQRRAKYLADEGIDFLDVGISGGVTGARYGGCLMIGGDKNVYENLRSLFEDLSKEGSFQYLGKSGAGHLVKGYHNLVEYGYLQALAEGLVSINGVSQQEGMDIDLVDVCNIWNNGSIVESRLVGDAKVALSDDLENISGSVFGQTQKEMESLVHLAGSLGLELPTCVSAVRARMKSQTNPTLAGQIINSIRNVFGGHKEWR